MSNINRLEEITLGGGCFWCIETMFNRFNGVNAAISGYTGGKSNNPSYEEVCKGNSGHVEVVKINYNTEEISLIEILKMFFKMHDPTQINRQGDDIGEQYRSVIFYHTESQKEIAIEIIHKLEESKLYKGKIQTTVEPIGVFFEAESYHQDFFNQNKTTNSYCSIVVAPKVEKYELIFQSFLK